MPRAVKEPAEQNVAKAGNTFIENISRATTIHLGDGRKIAPGEVMEVSNAEAKALRESDAIK